MYVQAARQPGDGYWIVTSSLALFHGLLYMVRCTVAATFWSYTQLNRSRLTAADPHDITSGSVITPTSGESCEHNDKMLMQFSESCNVACSDDMMLQTTPSDVSMTCTARNDVDVTSYSLLSAGDVSQLLPVSSMDDEGEEEEECRLGDELREICRDLADIRACAQVVSARCHDYKWRRGDALTLGVTEALTPRKTASRHWANTSTVVDWRLDESPPAKYLQSRDRDVTMSDYTDRKLSLTSSVTCAAAEPMTSSPADDSVADIYIDDELDDVIA